MSSKHKPAPHHQDVLFSGYLAIGCGKVLVVSTWPHLYSTELGEIQTEKISPPQFQQKTGTRTVTQDILQRLAAMSPPGAHLCQQSGIGGVYLSGLPGTKGANI